MKVAAVWETIKKHWIACASLLALFLMTIAILAFVSSRRGLTMRTRVVPQEYWVIGPFGPGYDKSFEPEKSCNSQAADLAKPISGWGEKPVHWTSDKISPGVGCLDFQHLFRKDNSVGCAMTFVHLKVDQPGEIIVASDDTIVVWINGQLAVQSTRLRSAHPDQDRAAVKLQMGWNSVLIKIGNCTGNKMFYAKFEGAGELVCSLAKRLDSR